MPPSIFVLPLFITLLLCLIDSAATTHLKVGRKVPKTMKMHYFSAHYEDEHEGRNGEPPLTSTHHLYLTNTRC